jgi:hypothetical protein
LGADGPASPVRISGCSSAAHALLKIWQGRTGHPPGSADLIPPAWEDIVTVRRLVATSVIFLGASLAWAALGSSLLARAGGFDQRLEQEVEALWGRPHHQAGPVAQILRRSAKR